MSNILIADTQRLYRKYLSDELATQGHNVRTIDNSDRFMEAIEAYKPDIVLLDLFFNGFERWDLLRTIKLAEPDLPVVIISAFQLPGMDAIALEADGFANKNFSPDEIIDTITHLIDRKKPDFQQ